jgi:cytochrome c553
MSRARCVLAAVAALVAFAGHAVAGDAERGRELSVVCQACHGEDGNGVGDPQYPVIAGQYADYLALAMRAYQTGERQNVIMQGFMATLSDQDIDDLAAFFAEQTGPLGDLSHLK